MGQRGYEQQRGGCQKQAKPSPAQLQLRLQPLIQKYARLCTNVQLLHTCSKAKTHNTKVIAFFKTIPTM